MADEAQVDVVTLAAELTIAWLGNANTSVAAADVPAFLQTMHRTVSELATGSAATPQPEVSAEYPPAVSVRKSLASPDHILSMIDGKPYKTLRRHLAGHGLTPEQYRERYKLKPDYPMVAPAYSDKRRETAKRLGLGRKKPVEAAPAVTPKRGRRKKSEAAGASS